MVRGTRALAATLMLVAPAALAQSAGDTPAAPAAATLATPAAPTPAPAVEAPPAQYHLGKGPKDFFGYTARYEEDYSYLRDPNALRDFLSPLKFIPLDPAQDVYLTLNGEYRLRTDYTQYKNFGVASVVTPEAGGAPPKLTRATRIDENELYKQRTALGGDLHLGDDLRIYGEFYHAQQTGREVGPTVPANQRNELSLVNGFAEPQAYAGTTRLGVRAGRQELFFGNALNVGANMATSLPDPVFDGARAYADWGHARVDLFAFNRVKYVAGEFNDDDDSHVNFWGAYGSADLPPVTVLGNAVRLDADLFYFGLRARANSNGTGAGEYNDQALATGTAISGTTGAGFTPGQDVRHTVGMRYYGVVGPVEIDWEGMVQGGSFEGLTVRAWAFNTDTEYAFETLPWRPRVGTHIDAASGGASKQTSTIETYQPLLPNTYYYLPNSDFTPTNFYDVSPRIGVTPVKQLTIEVYYAFLWRYDEHDAIYTGNWKFDSSANSYAGTAIVPGRVIGRQPDVSLNWYPVPHVLLHFEYANFIPGHALRAIGARNNSYFNGTMQIKF